jgi:hypothetical protein
VYCQKKIPNCNGKVSKRIEIFIHLKMENLNRNRWKMSEYKEEGKNSMGFASL